MNAGRRPWFVDTVLAGLTAAAALFLWHIVATMGLPVSIDPNEGWNAYFATAAFAGNLYPVPADGVTNNYPPLSFYLVGAFAKWIGDAIVAGRIVALAAFVAVVAELFCVARLLGTSRRASLLAALVFAVGLCVFTDYVGLNDPQMLAHAASLGGALIVLTHKRSWPALIAAAACFALAFFVKHNVIVLAATCAAWLLWTDRKAGLRFAIAGLGFLGLGLGLFFFVYGQPLWAILASPRSYALARLLAGLQAWLIWNGLPLIAALALLIRRDAAVRFASLFAAIGLALGLLFLGGAGVDANAMFEADMALALCTALALDRLPYGRSVLATAVALPILWGAGMRLYDEGPTFVTAPGTYAATVSRTDIAFLRAHPGPAMCALPSFCYWAGKPFAVDAFNLSERFATDAAGEADLIVRIDRHAFSVIQFDPGAADVLGAKVEAAVRRSYRLDHEDDAGLFFVPKK